MVTFLYVLGSLGLLIAFGVGISLYLYQGGAIGKKSLLRSRSFRTLVFETITEKDNLDRFSIGVTPAFDTTARSARTSMVLLVLCLVVIVGFVTTFVGIIVH